MKTFDRVFHLLLDHMQLFSNDLYLAFVSALWTVDPRTAFLSLVRCDRLWYAKSRNPSFREFCRYRCRFDDYYWYGFYPSCATVRAREAVVSRRGHQFIDILSIAIIHSAFSWTYDTFFHSLFIVFFKTYAPTLWWYTDLSLFTVLRKLLLRSVSRYNIFVGTLYFLINVDMQLMENITQI